MKIGTAAQVSHDGVAFYVSIEGHRCSISTDNLGTVIGWAKISQRKAGLTCFTISDALEGLYFEPANPAPLEKLHRDLIVLLESIGFETNGIAFMESPSPLRRRPHQPIQVATTELPLNA